MRKFTLFLAGTMLLAASAAWSQATHAKPYSIAFYNCENFFDTIKDPNHFDEEFTPNGPKKWNTQKYNVKVANVEKVFYDIAATTGGYPVVIGTAEVESRSVLEDVVSTPKLQKANYQIVFYDSPDPRGISTGLIYRPDIFKYEGSYPITTRVEGLDNFKTRDILSVWGTIDGERFCFFVCHWPSRRGGQSASEAKRIGAAQTVRHAADSIMKLRPDTKIVIMGDLNDDPTDQSIYEALGAKGDPAKIPQYGLYNPFYEVFKKGYGTLSYNDSWNLFDNIIVNEALLHPQADKLGLTRAGNNKFYGNIFSRPYMIQQTGSYKNTPLRTYSGNTFLGGFSDHFPVYIIIAK